MKRPLLQSKGLLGRVARGLTMVLLDVFFFRLLLLWGCFSVFLFLLVLTSSSQFLGWSKIFGRIAHFRADWVSATFFKLISVVDNYRLKTVLSVSSIIRLTSFFKLFRVFFAFSFFWKKSMLHYWLDLADCLWFGFFYQSGFFHMKFSGFLANGSFYFSFVLSNSSNLYKTFVLFPRFKIFFLFFLIVVVFSPLKNILDRAFNVLPGNQTKLGHHTSYSVFFSVGF